jgi:hypothetical protein
MGLPSGSPSFSRQTQSGSRSEDGLGPMLTTWGHFHLFMILDFRYGQEAANEVAQLYAAFDLRSSRKPQVTVAIKRL